MSDSETTTGNGPTTLLEMANSCVAADTLNQQLCFSELMAGFLSNNNLRNPT